MTGTLEMASGPLGGGPIAWRGWGGDAFEEAARLDRPIFLYLTAPWCAWCREMDGTTLLEPAVVRRLNNGLLPIRVDTDRYPHVFDRYAAGGWPTTAFLTPTGEVLWAGTMVEAPELLRLCESVARAWSERREELRGEVARRQRAMHATVGRHEVVGLVRREAADDVESVLRDGFDARNGGFGTAPKFPMPRAVELACVLGERGDPDWLGMADRTLDGMLAGELVDGVDGGFFRYALDADWTGPRHEKLLEVNAAMLRAYALGAAVRGRDDWRRVAERTVSWVQGALALPEGLWAASEPATPGYHDRDANARAGADRPRPDATLLTHACAQWCGALADAGARFRRDDWMAAADHGLRQLIRVMRAPSGRYYHYRAEGDDPALDYLLLDLLAVGRACLDVAQATGSADAAAEARRIASLIEAEFWADDGGFHDRLRGADDHGALRYRDRPFEYNAETARFLLDLAVLTGERGFRACAERTLARLGPTAGRYGFSGAEFALAVHEYFEPPVRIFLVGAPAATATLRAAAHAAPLADRRIWTLPDGGLVGHLRIEADAPAALVCRRAELSAPLRDEDELRGALLGA